VTAARPVKAGDEDHADDPATVKAHITHILTKLDVGNRTQIALLAHDAGLT
jgi:DNA-binding CsgD family transcriptional regulator